MCNNSLGQNSGSLAELKSLHRHGLTSSCLADQDSGMRVNDFFKVIFDMDYLEI